MPQLAATFPEDLALNEGDEMDLHVVVVEGAFVVTRVLKRDDAKKGAPSAARKLGDWGRKWAGSSPVSDGSTRDEIRMAYYREKYGV